MRGIPTHIKNISKVVKEDELSLLTSLVCTCGGNDFIIMKNKNDPYFDKKCEHKHAIIRKYGGEFLAHSYSDDECRICINMKWPFSLFTKPTILADSETGPETVIYKVKCKACGCEHVIYDSRFSIGLRKQQVNLSEIFDFIEVGDADDIFVYYEYDMTEEEYNLECKSKHPEVYKDYEEFFQLIKIYSEKKQKVYYKDEP